jgi:hypothetical protein
LKLEEVERRGDSRNSKNNDYASLPEDLIY